MSLAFKRDGDVRRTPLLLGTRLTFNPKPLVGEVISDLVRECLLIVCILMGVGDGILNAKESSVQVNPSLFCFGSALLSDAI